MTSYLARVYYTPDGSTTSYAVPFPYISQSHVKVIAGGVTLTTGFSWSTSTTILFSPVLASAAANSLEIVRVTPNTAMLATIQTGTINPPDINLDNVQLLYITQEQYDQELYDLTSASGIIAQANAALAATLALAGTVAAATGMYPIPVAGIANSPGAATDYIVGTAPTGAFAGKANYVAHYNGTAWIFLPPLNGLQLQGTNLGCFFTYMRNAWRVGLCVGGDTSAISNEVFPLVDIVQDYSVSSAYATCVSSFGSIGGPTSHWHAFSGTPAAPTFVPSGRLIFDFGMRACRETGHVGGSPTAFFSTLLEDSNGIDYPGTSFQIRTTNIAAGGPGSYFTMYGANLGLNDLTPATSLSVQLFYSGPTKGVIRNTSALSGASAQWIVDNGTSQSQIIQYGTGVSTSGITRADGMLINGSGAGGLCLNTAAIQPIYFGIHNAIVAQFDTSGNFVPNVNNAITNGSAGAAWKNIYSVNALTVTSDEAVKKDIRDLTPAEISVGLKVRDRCFKRIGGDRLHYGVVAQEIEELFKAEGIDPYASGVLGMFALTEDKEVEETVEEDVHVMTTIVHRKERVEIIDGLAVRSYYTETEEVPAMDNFPMVDAEGQPIMERGRQLTHPVHRMERKSFVRKVLHKDVPVLDAEGNQVMRRFVRHQELDALRHAAHQTALKTNGQ